MESKTSEKRAMDAVEGVMGDIGGRLREVRRGLGLTQEGMAGLTGFSKHQISDCETGRSFNAAYVAKASELGGVSVPELMGVVAPAGAEAVEVEVVEPEPDRGAELAGRYGELARQCALLTAAAKLVKSANDAARSELRAIAVEMRGLGNCPKTSDVIVNGTKVGSLTMAAGPDWAVDDEAAYGDWALDRGLATEHRTIDSRDLTDAQREMLEVWAHANGVEPRRHVTVLRDAAKAVHRIGGSVVSDDGEVVPGLVPCEPDLTPRMTVRDPKLAFAACGAYGVLGIDREGFVGPAAPVLEGEAVA